MAQTFYMNNGESQITVDKHQVPLLLKAGWKNGPLLVKEKPVVAAPTPPPELVVEPVVESVVEPVKMETTVTENDSTAIDNDIIVGDGPGEAVTKRVASRRRSKK